MPIHRYEIRNEYSLADPDLYRAADKDDPEALLEGVAMAGLVGLLRQLGDLAEFAAEIFHDLHEEVMATSARGHGLMIRVQQLESDIPSIEKAFLSQTDHSSFFYTAGLDWRSNLRLDQNLVTQGDMPRFIMDSYEECRGPPRLFLLDKFDVAGAGACLKRFTDPSFYKVENTADVQREKKIRKTKKKGQRWRNGGTPEVLPSAHAKLHQLFLEERVDNGVTNASNPARRVKLKRRLNGFPFDSRTGKSYMEKVLQNPSPEHTIHEVSMSSALVVLHTNEHTESGLDLVEFDPLSPRKDSMERDIIPIIPNPSAYEPNEVFRNDKILEVSNSYPSTVSDETSYALDNTNDENDMHVGGESKTEGSVGYESDGISCEIENYVDAPSTMGSEVDTDSELRGKSDFSSSLVKTQSSYVNEDLQTRSSDSHSTTEPTLSDEGNNSSKKETSSFSLSQSPGNSAENAHPSKLLSERSSSADNDLVDDASSYQKTSDGDFSVDRHLNQGVPDYSCSNKDKITSPRSDIEQLPSSLFCSGDSVPMLSHSDSEEAVREDMTRACEIEDVVLMLNDEDGKEVMDPLCPPTVLDPEFQLGNEDDDLNTETQPHTSTVSEITVHKDSSGARYSDLLHEDDSDDGLAHVENSASSDMSDSFSHSISDVPETNFNDGPGAGKLYSDATEFTENIFSECSDVAANGAVTLSREEVSEGDIPTGKIYNGESNISSNELKWVSYRMEASHDKELSEASLSNAEEHHSHNSIENQVGLENIILPSSENSPDWPEEVTDSPDRDVVDEESTTNKICNDFGLQGPAVSGDLLTKDSADKERSSSTAEFLEEEGGLLNSVQDDGINLHTEPIGEEVVGDLVSEDIKSLNDYECEDEKLETTGADSTTDRNGSVTVGPHKWVEAHTPEISGWNELQDSNSLLESQREPGLLEEVGQREAASSGLINSAVNYDTENGHLKLEESDGFPKPEVDSNVAHIPNFVDDITTELLQVQRGFDIEQEASQQSVPMPISEIGELVPKEEFELQNNQLNEKLLDSQEISLGHSPIFAADPQKMPDHADGRIEESLFSFVKYPSPPSFPPINVSCEANEISLDDLPPLPPLPPVQWRMGKILQASSTASESEEIMSHESLTPITSLPNGFTNAITTSEQQIDQTLVQITPEIAAKEEELEDEVSSADANFMNMTTELLPEVENEPAQPSKPTNAISFLGDTPHSQILINLETAPNGKKLENALINEKVESVCILDKKIDLQLEIDEEQHPMSSHNDVSSSIEEMNDSSVQIDLETNAEQQKVQPCSEANAEQQKVQPCSEANAEQQKVQPSSEANAEKPKVQPSSEANAVPETKIIPLKVENEQLKLLLPFTARELPVPPVEDGVSNGIRLKVPRAPNPLFEDVAALDKSKLRKVTERIRPQIQKVDERDSLLEQIRTKSFNLKPASASRPSIQGPRTNLKVAAILEKANQIRQAFAGSDEDDEDNWSDS